MGRLRSSLAGWRRWLVAATAVTLVYGLAGFLLAPPIVRSQVIDGLEATLSRPVTIESLRINPFALSAEVKGFELTESDGSPLVAFERFYANLQLSSLFRWAWTFRELRLESPEVELVRESDGTVNLAQLVALDQSAPEPAEDAPSLPRIVIGELAIAAGAISVTDRVPASEFVTLVGPINIAMEDLSTLPESEGRKSVVIETEGGARWQWTGGLQLNPFSSRGIVTGGGPLVPVLTRYLQDRLAFGADDGRIELEFDYGFGLRPDGTPEAVVESLTLDVLDLTLVRDAASAPFAAVPAIRVVLDSLTWPEREVSVGRVTVDRAEISAVRNEDGVLNLEGLIVEPPAAAQPAQIVEPDDGAWALSLDELAVTDFSATLTDRALQEPGTFEVGSLALTVHDISNGDGAQFPFALAATIGSGGRIEGDGAVGVLPMPTIDSRLTVEALALDAAQPYLSDIARVTIDGGTLAADIEVSLNADRTLTATASVTIDALDVSDAAQRERLIGWDSVVVDGLSLDSSARSVEISEITMRAPYARLFIDTDGGTNFQELAIERGSDEQGASVSAAGAEDGSAYAFSLGRLQLEQGASDFTDLSLPLPFATRMTELNGELSTLVTGSAEPATLSLEGQIDEYGLAQIEGNIHPSGPAEFLDVDLFFRNVAMPELSPYTARFAGRTIADGSLELSLSYAIENGALTGENDIVISDLELGERVEHPDALDLPLDLAVALMTGADGRIDIDLPVRGDLGDPQFRLSGVVMAAFGNLITGLVTSPFRLLGRLVGAESEDFDRIEFEAGEAELAPPEREKLELLASALTLRPNLGLVVPRVVAADADTAALQVARVDARIGAAVDALDPTVALLDRRRTVLESLWVEAGLEPTADALRAQFMPLPGDAPVDVAPSLDSAAYLAALRDGLVMAEPIAETDLDALADARVAAVRDLLGDLTVSTAQLTVGERVDARPNDAGWIPLELDVQ